MKLLLDQSLSHRMIKSLVDVYVDSTQVGLLAMGEATDKDIWEYRNSMITRLLGLAKQ